FGGEGGGGLPAAPGGPAGGATTRLWAGQPVWAAVVSGAARHPGAARHRSGCLRRGAARVCPIVTAAAGLSNTRAPSWVQSSRRSPRSGSGNVPHERDTPGRPFLAAVSPAAVGAGL